MWMSGWAKVMWCHKCERSSLISEDHQANLSIFARFGGANGIGSPQLLCACVSNDWSMIYIANYFSIQLPTVSIYLSSLCLYIYIYGNMGASWSIYSPHESLLAVQSSLSLLPKNPATIWDNQGHQSTNSLPGSQIIRGPKLKRFLWQ